MAVFFVYLLLGCSVGRLATITSRPLTIITGIGLAVLLHSVYQSLDETDVALDQIIGRSYYQVPEIISDLMSFFSLDSRIETLLYVPYTKVSRGRSRMFVRDFVTLFV